MSSCSTRAVTKNAIWQGVEELYLQHQRASILIQASLFRICVSLNLLFNLSKPQSPHYNTTCLLGYHEDPMRSCI